MIQILDNVFNNKDIDTFYGEFRDFTAWKFTGGVGEKNWRKFDLILDKTPSMCIVCLVFIL